LQLTKNSARYCPKISTAIFSASIFNNFYVELMRHGPMVEEDYITVLLQWAAQN